MVESELVQDALEAQAFIDDDNVDFASHHWILAMKYHGLVLHCPSSVCCFHAHIFERNDVLFDPIKSIRERGNYLVGADDKHEVRRCKYEMGKLAPGIG